MPCPCGQPTRPRVNAKKSAPTLCLACLKARQAARRRRWREANRDIVRLNRIDWRRNNHARDRATENARRAAKRQRLALLADETSVATSVASRPTA
jgi:hypothetical protein